MITKYPYYAVKDMGGYILHRTLRIYSDHSIHDFLRDFSSSTGNTWEQYEKEGYSIVRVAIVEEPFIPQLCHPPTP